MLEALVALSLFALLMTLLCMFFNQLLRTHYQRQEEQKIYHQARNIIHLMTSDFHQIPFSAEPFFQHTHTNEGDYFFFLSRSFKENKTTKKQNVLVAIAYFLCKKKNLHTLYRIQASSEETLMALKQKKLSLLFQKMEYETRKEFLTANATALEITPLWLQEKKLNQDSFLTNKNRFDLIQVSLSLSLDLKKNHEETFTFLSAIPHS